MGSCLCVFVCVCVFVCLCIYMYVFDSICLYVCTCAFLCTAAVPVFYVPLLGYNPPLFSNLNTDGDIFTHGYAFSNIQNARHRTVPPISTQTPGDLYTRNDMINLRRRSGADGIMLARPALYNLSIFRKPPPPSTSHGDQPPSDENKGETNEETRYGYDSPLLLSKTTVVKDYLASARHYQTHYKNAKYVVCEMMNNRRTPSGLSYLMPQVYPEGQSIDGVCKCRSMEDMCRLWNVSVSTVVGDTTNGDAGLLHRYDDRYFLDPEGLQKVRQRQEEQARRTTPHNDCTIAEEKKDGSLDNDNDGEGGRIDATPTVAKRARLEMEQSNNRT